MKRNPLLIWSSTLVALQILTAGAALSDIIGGNLAAFVALVVAAAQGGTQFYVNGQLTPSESVVAQTTAAGAVVAGPASWVVDGHPVAVEPVETPPAE